MRENPFTSISHGPPHSPRMPSMAPKLTKASAMAGISAGEKPKPTTALASSINFRPPPGGVSRTRSATAQKASAASAAQAKKPARQPEASTSQASGLADNNIPELPVACTMPAQTPNCATGMERAAKAIGAIIIPEQPMPMMLCATTIESGPVAKAASTAPVAAMLSSTMATRREPQRSSATPTGIIASAKASGKAPVMAESVSVPMPRSRESTSADTAGSVRTALLKTWPMVRAKICAPTGRLNFGRSFPG